MLKPTHLRAGIFFGQTIMVIALAFGIFATFNFTGLTLYAALVIVLSGSVFGSEFPDIDSPRSIPRRHHPIWGMIFEFFRIKHRGKFSHSLLSESLFWSLITFIAWFAINQTTEDNQQYVIWGAIAFFSIVGGHQLSIILTALTSLFRSDAVKLVGVWPMIMYIVTDDKDYAQQAHYRDPKSGEEWIIRIFSWLVNFVFFFTTFNGIGGGDYKDVITKFAVLYFIAVWFGVVSHWVMDLSTMDGVWLGWNKQLHPMKLLLRHKWLAVFAPSQFRTGSKWENKVRVIISIGIVILLVVLIGLLIKGPIVG